MRPLVCHLNVDITGNMHVRPVMGNRSVLSAEDDYPYYKRSASRSLPHSMNLIILKLSYFLFCSETRACCHTVLVVATRLSSRFFKGNSVLRKGRGAARRGSIPRSHGEGNVTFFILIVTMMIERPYSRMQILEESTREFLHFSNGQKLLQPSQHH